MAKRLNGYQYHEDDFKICLVKQYLSGSEKRLSKVASLNGVKESTLRGWVKKYQTVSYDITMSKSKQDEKQNKLTYKSLELEFKQAKLENEYLKKKLLSQGESPTFIANLWSSRVLGWGSHLLKDVEP
jgi:transposase-like protein